MASPLPVDADEDELQLALAKENEEFESFAKSFETTNSPALQSVGRKPRSGVGANGARARVDRARAAGCGVALRRRRIRF